MFRSFCTKPIHVLTLCWVSLGVHFCLFFIWKGRFSWSVFDFGLISLKWTRSLIRRQKFSASLSNYFLLYLFGVGTKLRFLFKILKASKENECFDKFITCSDGSGSYLILLLIACCMPIAFLFCWIKVVVAWPSGMVATCAFFGLSPVMLLIWDCFKIRISFFRFSISLCLGLGSCLVLFCDLFLFSFFDFFSFPLKAHSKVLDNFWQLKAL